MATSRKISRWLIGNIWREVSLPVYSKMSDQDVQDVIAPSWILSQLWPMICCAVCLICWQASLGLILLVAPVSAADAVDSVDSAGPIFYRAQRVGKDGVLFYLYKFRSMTAGADKQGPGITAAGDSRVTRVGRFLRRTKLDELPQLINVLKGEMSLVGPRPEDPRYVALYTPEQRPVLAARPGITSAASLQYRHEEQLLSGADWETVYRQEVMPAKINIDLAYWQKRTVWSDLRLICADDSGNVPLILIPPLSCLS
jgi:lipopolysaccharide/colanic/teichoic acid biosynthesis glycosyltransferase